MNEVIQIMSDNRPHIVTWSQDGDDSFNWMSDGWYRMKDHGKPEADALFDKAHRAIEEGKDVPDVVRRLEEAGFRVTRVDAIVAHEFEAGWEVD